MALWRFGYRLASQSRAATRSRVPTAMAKTHKFSASQVEVFPNVLKSQETIEPMIPGRAAATLPAKLARAHPRACMCFFSHSFNPLLSGGLEAGAGALSPPPVSASTRVEIAMPIAVRIDAIVIPCSRNRVRMRSASVVSSWRSRLNVSWILLIWDRRVALFVERASSFACLSSSMSESTLSSFLIRSRIFQCRLFPSVFDAPGRGVFQPRIFRRRYSSAPPGCLPTRLSFPSLPFRAQPALFWPGRPTRCRLTDHQSSSQLVLRFDARCRLC